MTETPDIRLIEAGFPCHQVGAETTRERDTGKQPPTARLHVWWARRPLTPSRAAILASLLPAGTDPEAFVRQLGIERVQALVHGVPWTLTGKLLERVERHAGQEVLPVDAVVLRALEAEQERRADNRRLIERLREQSPDLQRDPILARWEAECAPLPDMPFNLGDALPLQRVAGDPAHVNERIEFAKSSAVKSIHGGEFQVDSRRRVAVVGGGSVRLSTRLRQSGALSCATADDSGSDLGRRLDPL